MKMTIIKLMNILVILGFAYLLHSCMVDSCSIGHKVVDVSDHLAAGFLKITIMEI